MTVLQLRQLLSQFRDNVVVEINERQTDIVLQPRELPSGHHAVNFLTLDESAVENALLKQRECLDRLLETPQPQYRDTVLPGEEE